MSAFLLCNSFRSIEGLSMVYRWFIDGFSRLSRGYIPHFPLSPHFPLLPHICGRVILLVSCARDFMSEFSAAVFCSRWYSAALGVLCSALSTPSLSLSCRVSVAVFCSRRYSAVCLLSPMQSYNIFFKNANNYSLFCTIVPKNLQMSINFRTFAHSITKSQILLWQTTKRLSSRWLA